MLPVDTVTRTLLLTLAQVRADACISIYVQTAPFSSEIGASRIAYANAVRAAFAQLDAAGLDKRRRWPLEEQFDDLAEDDAFWNHQARSLAVLATPEHVWTFRLANRLAPTVQVADRFHLKPLLRALTHPHAGYVLALSENSVRLIEFFPDMAPVELRVPGMPKDAASAVGKASINDRSHSQRIVGSEGKKVRLRQYARQVDEALRAAMPQGSGPMILASNPPLDEVFRSVASYPDLLAQGFRGEVDRMTPLELVESGRKLLDAAHAESVAAHRALHVRRTDQARATTDVSIAARAAARGAIEILMVDMDTVVPGTVDDETGAVYFAVAEGADSYGVLDRIAMMALATGADVLSVRAADLPEGATLAATLRYPM
jgi:hypothetical protein